MKTSLTGAKHSLPAFSLLEMLLVVTIFSIAMLIVTQTFSSFTRLHRKIANQSVLTQDMRFTLELLVRTVRNRALSYSVPIQASDSQIRLQQENGVDMIIRRSAVGEAVCGDAANIACLVLSTDGGTTWAPLTAKHIHVEQFDVYVRPTQSPFVVVNGSYPSDVQPFVTFVLKERYIGSITQEQTETMTAQTTVSSRIYQR